MNRPSPLGGEGLRGHKANRTIRTADYTRRLSPAPSPLQSEPGSIYIGIAGPAGGISAVLPNRELRQTGEHAAKALPRQRKRREALVSAALLEATTGYPDDERSLEILALAFGSWWMPSDFERRRDLHKQVDRILARAGAASIIFEVVARSDDVVVRTRFQPVPTARAA